MGPQAPFLTHGSQGHKIKAVFSGTGGSAVGWAAPLTSEYQERSVQRRGVCIESGCRAQSALQRAMRRPGRGKSGSPGQSPGHSRGAGRGKAGPSLTCRERAPVREWRGGARAITRRPGCPAGDAPEGGGGGSPPGTRSREEGRGARGWAGARGVRGQRRQEEGAPPRVAGPRERPGPGWFGGLTPCGSSSGFAGGGGSSGGGSSGSASSTAPPSLRRLLRLRSPPPPTTTFGDVTPVT